MLNPLLDFSALPRFADIRPEHVAPALEQLIGEGRAAIDRLATASAPPTWENFVEPLDDANERLGRAWSQVTHLNFVVNTPALREAYNAGLPKVTEFFTAQGQDLRLFSRFRALASSPAFAALPPARRRHVENELRDFRLGGAELPEADKARFKLLQEELAGLAARFQDNVLDATNAFSHVETDPAHVAGIPADVLEAAKALAAEGGQAGWKFTLHAPSYMPVMQYADHRPLRELLYHAFVTRAAEFGKPDWDNGPLIGEILARREEAAKLLGFASFAEVSLATKMADSPAEVVAFLEDLAARAKPHAERDMAQVRALARDELGLAEIGAWDVAWVSEKLRQKRYAFSENEVKQYFPEDVGARGPVPRGRDALRREGEAREGASRGTRTCASSRSRTRTAALVGQFYLDLYARDGKRGGAWMDDAINAGGSPRACRRRSPISPATSPRPSAAGPRSSRTTRSSRCSTSSATGCTTCSRASRTSASPASTASSGTRSSCPPSSWRTSAGSGTCSAHMTRHVDTGEAAAARALRQDDRRQELPERPAVRAPDRVRAVRHAPAPRLRSRRATRGSACSQEVRAAGGRDPAAGLEPLSVPVLAHLRRRLRGRLLQLQVGRGALGRRLRGLRGGGRAQRQSTGARFRDEILGVGGSRPALESFVAFRGRKPSMDALLRHNGMTSTA